MKLPLYWNEPQSLFPKCFLLIFFYKFLSLLHKLIVILRGGSRTSPRRGRQSLGERLPNIFTARVRSTREGNVLIRVCVSVHTCRGGGYPISGLGRGVPHLRFGGYPISGCGVPHLRSGSYPILGLGVPHPRSGVPHLRSGGTPSQVWTGGTPSKVWTGWVPHPRSEQGDTWATPHHD